MVDKLHGQHGAKQFSETAGVLDQRVNAYVEVTCAIPKLVTGVRLPSLAKAILWRTGDEGPAAARGLLFMADYQGYVARYLRRLYRSR